ncbi:MAG: MarC family protein [Myxococcota bacterium]
MQGVDAAMDWSQLLRMFVGLFTIMNPIGAIPLFLAFTDNIKQQRANIAHATAVAVGIVLIISMFLGNFILHFFNISVDAFKTVGGILLMFVAFNMMHAHQGRTRHTPEEDEEAIDSTSVAVVPLAIPLLAGPGAISTVILFGQQSETIYDKAALLCICIVAAVAIWIILYLAPQISNRMSRTSMNVATRVMGLILGAMAIEFIVGGLRHLLPGLASACCN